MTSSGRLVLPQPLVPADPPQPVTPWSMPGDQGATRTRTGRDAARPSSRPEQVLPACVRKCPANRKPGWGAPAPTTCQSARTPETLPADSFPAPRRVSRKGGHAPAVVTAPHGGECARGACTRNVTYIYGRFSSRLRGIVPDAAPVRRSTVCSSQLRAFARWSLLRLAPAPVPRQRPGRSRGFRYVPLP